MTRIVIDDFPSVRIVHIQCPSCRDWLERQVEKDAARVSILCPCTYKFIAWLDTFTTNQLETINQLYKKGEFFMECPHCAGRGYNEGFMCGTACTYGRIKCKTCNESGQITPQQDAKIIIGAALRAGRRAARVTVRERAEAVGISVVELSKIEHVGEAETEKGKAYIRQILAESGAAT